MVEISLGENRAAANKVTWVPPNPQGREYTSLLLTSVEQINIFKATISMNLNSFCNSQLFKSKGVGHV